MAGPILGQYLVNIIKLLLSKTSKNKEIVNFIIIFVMYTQ